MAALYHQAIMLMKILHYHVLNYERSNTTSLIRSGYKYTFCICLHRSQRSRPEPVHWDRDTRLKITKTRARNLLWLLKAAHTPRAIPRIMQQVPDTLV